MSTATERCELKVVGSVVTRSLHWFEHSLSKKRRLIVEEIQPAANVSPGLQAGLLDLSLARFKIGIEMLQQGECKSQRLRTLLTRLHDFQRQLTHDIHSRIRNANATSDWCEAGLHLIDNALQQIIGFREEAQAIGDDCDI